MGFFRLFSKPKPSSDPSLPEPDLDFMVPFSEKYEALLSKDLDPINPVTTVWMRYKMAFDDMMEINFSSISNYMDHEVYKGKLKNKEIFYKSVKWSTTFAASGGWMIGREWGTYNQIMYTRIRDKYSITKDDVPADALTLLHKTVYFPFWIFASTFTDFYNSWYGQFTRHQKDDHFKDTYNGLMNGVLVCFLDGVKSNNL